MEKHKLDIIYEDSNIIVVNKKAGLLTIAIDSDNKHNLYHYVYEYLHKKNQKVFVVHRLDRDTSGLVLFAKNEKIKKELQDNWDNYVNERCYYAVIEGHLKEKKNKIVEYLNENKQHMVYSTSKKDGRIAITNYEVVNETKSNSLVKINIETGRKNQIRVAFSDLNHPIVGDRKYGSKYKGIDMMLHFYKLNMYYPVNKKNIEFISDLPSIFNRYIKK